MTVAEETDVVENAPEEVKGPDPGAWSDEARSERGAERSAEAIAAEGPQFGDDGELVKGPDAAHWGDEPRAERGADLLPHQGVAVPPEWTEEQVTEARARNGIEA